MLIRTTRILLAYIILAQSTSVKEVYGQDVHFSQFYENATLRNPALTGIMSGDYKAGILYRNQWKTLSVPFTTAVASYDTRMIVNRDVQDYISFGVTAMNYKAGRAGFSTTSLYGTISYSKSLEDNYRTYFSIGFAGAYFQRAFDISKMTFANQYVGGAFNVDNPSNEIFRTNSATGYDIGAGISLNGKLSNVKPVNYYIGGAAYNIVPYNESYVMNTLYLRRAIRWTTNLGLSVPLNNIMSLVIHANYQSQGPYSETIIGGLLTIKDKPEADKTTLIFSAGSFYRLKDAVIPTVKLEYHNWALNFSYDYGNIGRFGNVNFGSYELSLFVKGFYKHKREYNELKCPMFEEMILNN